MIINRKENNMITSKKKQFITDDNGNRVSVILDISTYKKMQDELDDYYCRKAYDRVKRQTDREIAQNDYATVEDYAAKRRKKALKAK